VAPIIYVILILPSAEGRRIWSLNTSFCLSNAKRPFSAGAPIMASNVERNVLG